MITKKELEEYAKIKGFQNLGYSEKDYFQNIILFILSKEYGKEIVFKGGTALSKCFGLNRFSEDLDFDCEKEIEFKKLNESLKRFKIDFKISEKKYKSSVHWIIKIKGPLYIGIKNSICKILLDISLREKVILKPEIKNIGRFMEELPSFDILVMKEEEIFAEKIRTIMTRNKARDVYDLDFLIKRNIKFNKKLVNEKLKYYGKKWNKKEFVKELNNKKNIWDSELKNLIENVPKFNEIKKNILQNIK